MAIRLTMPTLALAACRQLGIVDFEPLKPYFMDLLTASQAYLPNLPGLGPITIALDREWSAEDPTKPPTAPALVRYRWSPSSPVRQSAHTTNAHTSTAARPVVLDQLQRVQTLKQSPQLCFETFVIEP